MKIKKLNKVTTFLALLFTMGQLFVSPALAVADHIESTRMTAVSKEDDEEQIETVPTEVKPFRSDESIDEIKRSAGLQSENARANDSPEESDLPVVDTIGGSLFILPSETEVIPLDETEDVEVSGDFDDRYTLDYVRNHARSTTEQEEMLSKSEEYAQMKAQFTRSTGFTIENVRTIDHRLIRLLPGTGIHFTHDKFFMFRIKETGEIGFCIEEDALVYFGGGATQERLSQVISDSNLRRRLSLTAYFGWYGNSDKSDTQYVAVQQMIWEEFGGTTLSTSVPNYATRKNSVAAEINSYNTRPSFHGQRITLKVGETVTLTDSNGVFSNYAMDNLTNTANVTLRQEGNRLHITANANSNESGSVAISRIPKNYASTPLVYRIGNYQRMSVLYVDDPINVNLNIDVLKEGHAEVLKVDEETGLPLAGAVFRFVTSDGQEKELTTGADGKARWENLMVDTTVTITEIKAPNGYILNSTPQTLTIRANETTTVRFDNKEQLANLTVIKEDEETGNAPQGAATLFGAKYDLTDADGNFVATLTMDNVDGISQAEIKGLKLGTYFLQEVEAPEGYNRATRFVISV